MCVCVFSLLLQQNAELLQRAVSCPGFLHTAVLCYINLLQLFLEGHTLTPTTEPSDNQVTEPQMTVYIGVMTLSLKPVTLLWSQIYELYCQMEPFQILSCTKQFLLRAISQASPAALSSSQLRQVTNKHIQYTSVLCPLVRSSIDNIHSSSSLLPVWPLCWWVSWSSSRPSVQTWTQRWQQLSLCTSTFTASAQRWTSSEQLRTDVQTE